MVTDPLLPPAIRTLVLPLVGIVLPRICKGSQTLPKQEYISQILIGAAQIPSSRKGIQNTTLLPEGACRLWHGDFRASRGSGQELGSTFWRPGVRLEEAEATADAIPNSVTQPPSSSTLAGLVRRLGTFDIKTSSRSTGSLVFFPPLGLGSEYRVPRRLCFLRTPNCSAPSGPMVSSTLSRLALPH